MKRDACLAKRSVSEFKALIDLYCGYTDEKLRAQGLVLIDSLYENMSLAIQSSDEGPLVKTEQCLEMAMHLFKIHSISFSRCFRACYQGDLLKLRYHFMGNKETGRIDKLQWMLTYISNLVLDVDLQELQDWFDGKHEMNLNVTMCFIGEVLEVLKERLKRDIFLVLESDLFPAIVYQLLEFDAQPWMKAQTPALSLVIQNQEYFSVWCAYEIKSTFILCSLIDAESKLQKNPDQIWELAHPGHDDIDHTKHSLLVETFVNIIEGLIGTSYHL